MGLQKRLPLTGIQVKFEWCMDIRKTSQNHFWCQSHHPLRGFSPKGGYGFITMLAPATGKIFACTDWGWRPKELYVFWIGKLPLFMFTSVSHVLGHWNDNVMTWNDNRMRCNDNGIHHCNLVASFFLCLQLQEISFLPREICPYKFRRVFFSGGRDTRHEENP